MKRKFRTTLKIKFDAEDPEYGITFFKESMEDWKSTHPDFRHTFRLVKLHDLRGHQCYIEFFVCITPLFFIKGILYEKKISDCHGN